MEPVLGFIGVGDIGAPMCRCLLDRGYDVLVHDEDPEALERFRETPAKRAASIAGIARAADVVVLSLPNSNVVERVVFGEGGLEEGFSDGKVLIDASSSRPSSTKRIAAHLARKGVHMLDAPVSGGVLRAKGGYARGDGRRGEGGAGPLL